MADYEDDFVSIHHGDCLTVMADMEPDSIDAIVTDPPYGLSFMGREWDHGVPGEPFWAEALRVAKPGAHLVAFGGTRTYHRLACAIEDAGWEVRDCLGWLYGSGFPKSLDVSKAIDKEAGAEREAAQRWQGWGTALKPAWEPCILARKPLTATVARNVQQYGTGALNIDGCRVEWATDTERAEVNARTAPNSRHMPENSNGSTGWGSGRVRDRGDLTSPQGRWPANIVHDGSDEVLAVFPNDSQRFFYAAKADKRERDDGLFDAPEREANKWNAGGIGERRRQAGLGRARNIHPTVKPLALMRWLVRLVTPPDGVVLDPFMGSGTTLKAARAEGHRSIGIDLEREHCEIAWGRMSQGVLL